MLHSGVSCRSDSFSLTVMEISLIDTRIFYCHSFVFWHSVLFSVSAVLRVDWRRWNCRGCSTEGAEGRNRLQRGGSRSHSRYSYTETNSTFDCISCLYHLYLISCICWRGLGVPHWFIFQNYNASDRFWKFGRCVSMQCFVMSLIWL